jgi:UDP-3-O-[3-hydroxymyristoyl] glucosamine N-acyltransferase
MRYRYTDIKKIIEKYEVTIWGDCKEIHFNSIASLHFNSPTSLDWCTFTEASSVQEYIDKSPAKTIIVDRKCVDKIKKKDKILIFAKLPKAVIAEIANTLFLKEDFIKLTNSERMNKNEHYGNNVVIGKNCIIGKVKIGNDTIIYGNNHIFNSVIIGSNVKIYPGAVIGGPGFGFVKNHLSETIRFPHIGGVVIGDNVEIGANTVIDRGALEDTVIGDNTKIDSMVHIGHNVKIGKNSIICSNTTISGSVEIGENVWISPNCVIRDHLKIADNSFIGIGSVVVHSILKPKKVFGNPAKELRF